MTLAEVLPKPRARRRAARAAALSQPVLVAETAPQRFLRSVALLAVLGLFGGIGWSALARVHEVSQASGTIVPAGFEQVVQHFEGGIVEKILVRPGDLVAAGAPLFVLDDATTSEDVTVARDQRQGLLARIEALKAETEARDPDFAAFGAGPEVAAARLAFDERRAAQRSQKALLQSQIDQARLQVTAFDAQLKGLEDDRRFAEENLARIGQLIEKGYATASQQAERRKALQDVENDIRVTVEKRGAAAEKVGETEEKLQSVLAGAKSEVAAQLQDLLASRTLVDGDVGKKERRQDRLTVTSPVRGIVKALEITTLGGIARPGQPLATIVPLGETLHAETRVPVAQIGYLKLGMPAHVKVTAFDFTRFGWLEGRVGEISPSSFAEPGEAPFYRVRIDLADARLPFAPEARVIPGMAVAADIVTGDKTVLAYFLSPVLKALGTSFGER
ncbi:toxin-related secretion protein [Aureimonas endophytica]|uniref:Membrane fusion protein (MFP) family protein n=1 Tax=Aureimonas endophytica TaxID=2027858 RepID=A0A916ZU74_9HYPH|nr:HlyD family type I secretion periplasmic adaptor subunit [Aureimonas endophytica]GGE11768.1 toxin-related secretion protein [Aureimonas endophytica]